jgi:hypothetical protein
MERETTTDGIAMVTDVTSYDRALEDAHLLALVFGDDNEALVHALELLHRCELFEETHGWTHR